jgi:hypothetical protein
VLQTSLGGVVDLNALAINSASKRPGICRPSKTTRRKPLNEVLDDIETLVNDQLATGPATTTEPTATTNANTAATTGTDWNANPATASTPTG